MSRTIVASSSAPAAPPSYSQAVKAAGLVFVSGTAPIDPATGRLVEGPVSGSGSSVPDQYRGNFGRSGKQFGPCGECNTDHR